MKNFKFVLLLIFGAMLLTACGGGGGGGSSSDPAPEPTPDPKICYREAAEGEIEIKTADELKNIALTGKYILMDNITLSGEWAPIGTSTNPFIGELDGNCYKVTGLTITSDDALQYYGLFARLDNATISNIILEDVGINLTATLIGDYTVYAGSIAGHAKNSEIAESHSTGSITVDAANKSVAVGGLLGRLDGGAITDSYNAADISATVAIDDIAGVGGIAGEAEGLIDSVYNTGAILATSNGNSANPGSAIAYAGGIVAVGGTPTTLEITNSYNTGSISAQGLGSGVGGSGAYAGGIVSDAQNSSTISASYNAGAIDAYSINKWAYAGGIAANATGQISNTYSASNVRAESVNLRAYAGGIAAGSSSSVSISKSYSSGNISAVATTSYAGGIMGDTYGGTITNSVALNMMITANTEVGYILGNGSATLTDNAARDNIDAGISPTNTDGVYSPRPVDDFKLQPTYEALGWDFTNTWKMGASFPVFQWEE